MRNPNRIKESGSVGAVLFGILVLIGLVTLFTSIRVVGTGEIGVVNQYGKVTGRELGEGMALVAPWGINGVTKYNIKTQIENQKSAAATKDLQDANAKVVVNYRLEKGKVSEIHQTVGSKYKNILLEPAIQSSFKSNTAQYTALQLVSNRGEVETKVAEQLRERLSKKGILIESVSLADLKFSKEFTKAIEQRQVAQQNAERAKFNLEQARLDAQSQEVQAETLTEEYLKLKELENQRDAISKWRGDVPQALGGNGTLFNIPIK